MNPFEIPAPHDVMNATEQAELQHEVTAVLERWLAKNGKTWRAGLYFLVAFVWGWARRCGWKTDRLTTYAAGTAWPACARLSNESEQPWHPQIVAGEKVGR